MYTVSNFAQKKTAYFSSLAFAVSRRGALNCLLLRAFCVFLYAFA